ncbi:IS1 family transposase [Serratia fonticola]|uniref:IS1 family transposase n=1 Tax=Serratia fonticola TaxID=47917 RepID=UPI00192D0A4A|nr:hypothetical protein [Serratia fonticola]
MDNIKRSLTPQSSAQVYRHGQNQKVHDRLRCHDYHMLVATNSVRSLATAMLYSARWWTTRVKIYIDSAILTFNTACKIKQD